MLGEAAVLGLLIYRRVWRILPVFCAYVAWGLLSDTGGYAVQRFLAATTTHGYLIIYFLNLTVDSVLQIGVLIELAWSILRPLRPSLSRGALVAVGLLIVAVGSAVWPFVGIHGQASLSPAWRNLIHLQQTTSILRILFFLGLAGCSQLLSIGWRDRELQVASGFGFYSIVSLGVDIWRSHQAMGQQYKLLDQIVTASYVCSLLYWVFSFAQKEAERREFTPQMQSFILALAGTAKSTRMSLSDDRVSKNRDRRN
jgi:hypothetical protein